MFKWVENKLAERAERFETNQEGSEGSRAVGTDSYPAYFSPSYVHHNGKTMTVVRLVCRPATNRSLDFSAVLDLIPIPSNGVSLKMVVTDRSFPDDEKKRVISKNAPTQVKVIDEENSDAGDTTDNDAQNRLINSCDAEDYRDYILIRDTSNPLVNYDVALIITGDSRGDVEGELEKLNLRLKENHEGLSWDSTPGLQREYFGSLMTPLEATLDNFTSTGDNYAGLNFAISSGLTDPQGVPVGVDLMSLAGSSSTMDFNGRLRKLAVVASTSSMINRYVDGDEGFIQPASSVFGQAIANHVCINGARAHHLVLNDFDYHRSGMFIRPVESLRMFPKFNVAKTTINPLQGFGSIEEVTGVYNRLTNKIVNIFNVLEDLKLTQSDKAIILDAVQNFYLDQRLWDINAEQYPNRTRIVNIPNPETYPTMGMLINAFTSLARRAAKNNRELKADRVDTLYSILNHALTSHLSILGKPTSITDPKALQTYYDFSSIDSPQIVQVQLLNLFDYVLFTANPGDVIVLHGCDKIYETVFKELCLSFQAAYRKGVRLVTCFDAVSPAPSPVDSMASVFNLRGSLYVDLGSDVDYSIIGRLMPDEVDAFETALNTPLSTPVRTQLLEKRANQFLIHGKGGVNNFVYANVLI